MRLFPGGRLAPPRRNHDRTHQRAEGMRRAVNRRWIALTASAVAALGVCHLRGGKKMSLTITSTAFAANAAIPSLYTCEGKDISPPLAWSGAPAGTKSLALIVDDPDAPDPAAPKMTWVHWVLYNTPPTATRGSRPFLRTIWRSDSESTY